MDGTRQYPANVFCSDDDEGFIAIAPDLPGCSAFGETQVEALDQLQDAIVAWVEAARAAGNPIPKASRPAAEQHSGKVLLRMPRSLHAEVAQAAKREGVSLNQYLVFLVSTARTQDAMNQAITKAVTQVHLNVLQSRVQTILDPMQPTVMKTMQVNPGMGYTIDNLKSIYVAALAEPPVEEEALGQWVRR
jgi:predicted RNase H-like HicB family nuclease